MENNVIQAKSKKFAIRTVRLFKHLTKTKSEYVLSKQLLRSGTSIGANVAEGIHAQSKADFVAKLSIALKEAHETLYWLELLHETDFLSSSEFSSLEPDICELIALLTSILKTSRENQQKI